MGKLVGNPGLVYAGKSLPVVKKYLYTWILYNHQFDFITSVCEVLDQVLLSLKPLNKASAFLYGHPWVPGWVKAEASIPVKNKPIEYAIFITSNWI